MKQKIKQVFYDLRHQPVLSWVTLIATAMSIFLIMVIVMMQRVQVVPFSPESCRDRLLVGAFMHIKEHNTNNDSSAGLSYSSAKKLYKDLDGIEQESFMDLHAGKIEVKGSQPEAFEVNGRRADAGFFKIFDHPLIAGRYYTPEEAEAALPVVVISESTARRAFGSLDCIGTQISANHEKYTVVGIVRDNSPLALTGSGDIMIPTGPNDRNMKWGDEYFGPFSVAMLVKEGVSFGHIRDQVKARYAMLDTELSTTNRYTVYHEAPFDQEAIASGLSGSNTTPDTTSARNLRIALYAILLIVPAINLSSMLHSRMRRRVSEIGVRRAFGCTRSRLITDIIAENMIVTLIGGLVGLALGIIFASTYSGLYENMENYGSGATPAVSAVLNWGTILIAFGFCFLLNIISASVPAWQASRLNPVEAINAK